MRAPSLDRVRNGSVLKPGHQGASVRQIKELLNEVGGQNPKYGTPLVVNDDFDKEMLLKVTWFQRNYRQVYKRRIDGEVGRGTLRALEAVRDVKIAPPQTGTKAPDAQAPVTATDPTKAIAPENTKNPLGLTGSVGNRATNNPKDVRKVQDALVRHGYLKGSFTPEKMDAPTKRALKRFQEDQTRYKDQRVDVNGVTGRLLAQQTLSKPVRYLGLSNAVGVVSPNARVHASDVGAVQDRLVHHKILEPGSFKPGNNDDATIDAILKFQLTYTDFDDGRIDPAGMTSELLARDEPPRARPDAEARIRAEFEAKTNQPTDDKSSTDKPSEPVAKLVHATDAEKTAWIKNALANKTFHTHEPRTNLNGQPMPTWFNADAFAAKHELTGARSALTGNRNPDLPKSPATHFVVHETDGRGFGHRGPHLFIGMDEGRYKLQHDFAKRSSGTKLESRHARRLRQQGVQMVHVELETAPLKGNFPWSKDTQIYPEHQYKDLAIAYVMASHRAGRFLDVVPHREVDRGLADGHSDPRDFDFKRFYKEVAKLVDLPAGTTFGYDPARDGKPTKNQPRGPGGLNYANARRARSPSFPDIYGSL